MQLYRQTIFQNVELHEFGWGLLKKPPITVYCFYVDGLLIDTAQAHCQQNVLAAMRNKRLQQIALTHWHEDHTGNVSALQKAYQPVIYAHPFTAEKVQKGFAILPYEHYFFGKIKPAQGKILPLPDKIETEHYELTPIFTPGHSVEHQVFLERKQGWLFAGDLFVGVKIKVFRKDENIHQQMTSIRRVLQEDFDVIFCGHNPQLQNGKAAFEAKLQYFEDFTGEVNQLHQQGFSPREIIKGIGRQESRWLKWFTCSDVSLQAMVESAIYDKPTAAITA